MCFHHIGVLPWPFRNEKPPRQNSLRQFRDANEADRCGFQGKSCSCIDAQRIRLRSATPEQSNHGSGGWWGGGPHLGAAICGQFSESKPQTQFRFPLFTCGVSVRLKVLFCYHWPLPPFDPPILGRGCNSVVNKTPSRLVFRKSVRFPWRESAF